MRCNNCGWDNPNGLTKCEKCNTPFPLGLDDPLSSGIQWMCGTAAENHKMQSLDKTVYESEVFKDSKPINNNCCPLCGYPMRPGTTECPNCQSSKQVSEPQKVNTPSIEGTVNPWVQVKPANKCSLKPVEQQGVETPAICSLKGDVHSLNRTNLDPENYTITSKVQAQLTYEDGVWYIKDESAQHTTFIYAKEKTALKDGDIILMGNRQFVFNIE